MKHSHIKDHQIDWQAAHLITPINTWHPRRIRDAIEIFKHDTVPQDIGFYISNIWRPLLRTKGSSISKVHNPPQTKGSPRVLRVRRRLHHFLFITRTELCSMLDRDLAQVSAWGQDWIVTFNDRKTKLISVSRSKDRNFPAVHMGPQVFTSSEDLRILGMDISSDLRWGKYISGIAKSAVMRVGCLSRHRTQRVRN